MELKHYEIAANGISLHVTEVGAGPVVLFCHGFPDTSYTWRQQMEAVATAGFRAIAPDMRGYGRSSAPSDSTLYTPLQTAGDLVGLLDALKSLAAATAQSPVLRVGDAFPHFSAQTVTGKRLVLPEAASGKTALVVFTFGRASGKDGQTWNLRLAKDFQNPVPNFTIIFAESVPRIFQGRALSGIKNGMPQEMQNRAVLQLQDEQKWRTILGVQDEQRAYLLLLGPERKHRLEECLCVFGAGLCPCAITADSTLIVVCVRFSLGRQ